MYMLCWGQRISPAISVNKGCGSYQDVSHHSKPPNPNSASERIQSGEKEDGGPKGSRYISKE